MKLGTYAATVSATYKGLYRLGAAAAMSAAALTLGEIVAFAFYPQPGSADEWFSLFQSNRFVALVDFWGLELPLYAMFAIVFLALYVTLRKAGEARMALALVFALLGVAVFFATNNPFTMLSLSDRYAAATTEAQRAALLAAGQAVLATTSQRAVGGFNMGLFLVSIAGLMVSTAMLNSSAFTRLTAWVGILANALSLADYVRQALTSSAAIALVVIVPDALLLVTWFVLVGRKLYRMGRVERTIPLPVPGEEAF